MVNLTLALTDTHKPAHPLKAEHVAPNIKEIPEKIAIAKLLTP